MKDFGIGFLKISFLVSFGLFTLFCVSYAYSATQADNGREEIYRSQSLLQSCWLKVEQVDGVVVFSPKGASRTKFKKALPIDGESVTIPSPRNLNCAAFARSAGCNPEVPEEQLTVEFAIKDRTTVPVKYTVKNNKAALLNPHVRTEIPCSDLGRE